MRITRRQLVQASASLPMLPWAALAKTAEAKSVIVALDFIGMAAPTLAQPAQIASMFTAAKVQVRYANQTQKTLPLVYQPLFNTGDALPDGTGGRVVAGGIFNAAGLPIMDESVAGKTRQFFSDCPDGSSLLTLPAHKIKGVKGNAVFAVVQFEYTSRAQSGERIAGLLPSPMAVITLDQDKTTGKLTPVQYHNINTSSVHGLWFTCGASLSPWNTHLGSEEYEPDAFNPNHRALKIFSQAFYGDAHQANLYHYGHVPEVTVLPDGTGRIKKHYCMGRISHEVVQVMPDERTCLMGDDATHGGLFMFVADKPRDLSSGTLYCAQWQQTSSANGGSANLRWVKLGHATSKEIEKLIDSGIKPQDMMAVRLYDPQDVSYTRIYHSGRPNWVKLKPGMDKAAAFLETHRYAALKGATLGFTKMEGTCVDAQSKTAYTAMSYIAGSMVDGTSEIRVDGVQAGGVYAHTLRGGQRDTSGAPIHSEWVSTSMAVPPTLLGADLAQADALGNLANPNKIANPDNLKFSQELRTLFISEDSSLHVNNFLWAYQVDKKTLTRILSCPVGAESSGLHAVSNINGFAYIMSSCQHVGDWSALHARLQNAVEPTINASYRNRAAGVVGYLALSVDT